MSNPGSRTSNNLLAAADHRSAFMIAAGYAVAATAYILFSDWLVERAITDVTAGTALQNWKGTGFVVVTGILLYLVLKRQFRVMRESGLLALSAAQRLRAVSDALPNPVGILNRQGRLVHWNALARQMGGYSDEQLADKPATELVHPDDRQAVELAITQVIEMGVPAHADGRLLTIDGSLIPHRWHGSPLRDAGGDLTGCVVTGVDLSDLTEAQEKLRRSLLGVRNVLHQSVETIGLTLEKRDPYTAGHQRRVAALALAIAEDVGWNADEREGLKYAALLHDIGKLAIPSDILTKPAKLSNHEYQLVKSHAEHGYDIVRKIDFPWPVPEMILQHHERLDGSGYPQGLVGEAIIPGARILAVADVVEAMVSHRPYRPGLGVEAALQQVRDGAGSIYDADVVAACERVFEMGFTLPAPGDS